MTEKLTEGVDKWNRCLFAANQIELVSDGYRVNGGRPAKGINSDFSCGEIHVVETNEIYNPGSVDVYTNSEGKILAKFVEMHSYGNTDDLDVQTALNQWCRSCIHFVAKES